MNEKTCPLCHTSIPEHAPGGLCPACVLRGADETPEPASGPTVEEVAAAFPKLEILRLIGHGGMGYVYQARQPELDRMVALKILSPALRQDPAFEERFAREARVLGKLKHPNIVTLYEHGESGGYFYLMMEFVDGVNLRQAMSAGRFTPEQALAIVPAICDALQSAHAQGVWHRDIKPENILLDRDGRVKIADFGIARILGDPERNFTLTRTGGQLGSAAYMAPEQHEKPHSVDHRADIYSLGVVIYEMLTGELPLGRFPLPSQRAEVGKRIDEIVLRTLEKERELRQQSAGEVKTEVEGLASMPGPRRPGMSQSGNERPRSPFQDLPLGWLIIAPCIGAAIGLILMLLNKAGVPMSSQFMQAVIPVIFFAAFGVGIAVMKKRGGGLKTEMPQTRGPQWNFRGMVGSAVGSSVWMPMVAITSGWSGAGVALSDLTAAGVLLAALAIWSNRHRLTPFQGFILLLGAVFIASAIFLSGAHWLDLSVLSSWPGGKMVSAASLFWTLLMIPALGVWGWFMHKIGNSRSGEAPTENPDTESRESTMPERSEAYSWIPAILFLASFAGAALLFFNGHTIWKNHMARQWPVTEGRIVSSRTYLQDASSGKPGNAKVARADVRYSYSVNGRSYESANVSFAGHIGGRNTPAAVDNAVRYPEGTKVRVAYNPGNPSEAVLDISSDPYGWLVLGLLLFASFPVWRMVNRPLSGNTTEVAQRPLNRVAIAVALLAMMVGIFGVMAWVASPTGPGGIAAEFTSPVTVHCRVFEAQSALVDKLVPPDTRVRGDEREKQPGEVRSGTPPNAVAQMAEIKTSTVDSLLAGVSTDMPLLLDQRQMVLTWPRMADGGNWLAGNRIGSLGGFVGVRRVNGKLELRVDYQVSHSTQRADPFLAAEIFFKGNAPETNSARAFFIPFTGSGIEKYLVVAFEIEADAKADAQKLSFGPVVERVLPFRPSGLESSYSQVSCMDFQSGSVICKQWKLEELTRDEKTWSKANGVDAIADQVMKADGRDVPDLDQWPRLVGKVGRSVFVLAKPGETFDSLQAADVDANLQRMKELKVSYDYATTADPYWFQTGDGAKGIVQILGRTEDGSGMKMRYKLVQYPAIPAAGVGSATIVKELSGKISDWLNDRGVTMDGLRFERAPGSDSRVFASYTGRKFTGEIGDTQGQVLLNFTAPNQWTLYGMGEFGGKNAEWHLEHSGWPDQWPGLSFDEFRRMVETSAESANASTQANPQKPISSEAVAAYRELQEFLYSKQPREFADPDTSKKLHELIGRLGESMRGTQAEPLWLKAQKLSEDSRRAYARGDDAERRRLDEEEKQIEKELQGMMEQAGAPKPPDSNPVPKAPESKTSAARLPGSEFSRAVADPADDQSQCLVSLDTGAFSALPEELKPKLEVSNPHDTDETFIAWMRERRADAVARFVVGDGKVVKFGLRTFGVIAIPLHEGTPEQINFEEAEKRLDESLKEWGFIPEVNDFMTDPGKPVAFLVQSRSGQRGLLRITGFEEHPRSVNVHFRLTRVGKEDRGARSSAIPTIPADDDLLLTEQPPVVVETFPVSGARDVAPGETEIRVRFSKPMADAGWSWCLAWENSVPETIDQPHYEADGKTCVLKVKLEAGRTYAYWLNHAESRNFTSSAGQPAVPYLLIFQTRKP